MAGFRVTVGNDDADDKPLVEVSTGEYISDRYEADDIDETPICLVVGTFEQIDENEERVCFLSRQDALAIAAGLRLAVTNVGE